MSYTVYSYTSPLRSRFSILIPETAIVVTYSHSLFLSSAQHIHPVLDSFPTSFPLVEVRQLHLNCNINYTNTAIDNLYQKFVRETQDECTILKSSLHTKLTLTSRSYAHYTKSVGLPIFTSIVQIYIFTKRQPHCKTKSHYIHVYIYIYILMLSMTRIS